MSDIIIVIVTRMSKVQNYDKDEYAGYFRDSCTNENLIVLYENSYVKKHEITKNNGGEEIDIVNINLMFLDGMLKKTGFTQKKRYSFDAFRRLLNKISDKNPDRAIYYALHLGSQLSMDGTKEKLEEWPNIEGMSQDYTTGRGIGKEIVKLGNMIGKKLIDDNTCSDHEIKNLANSIREHITGSCFARKHEKAVNFINEFYTICQGYGDIDNSQKKSLYLQNVVDILCKKKRDTSSEINNSLNIIQNKEIEEIKEYYNELFKYFTDFNNCREQTDDSDTQEIKIIIENYNKLRCNLFKHVKNIGIGT